MLVVIRCKDWGEFWFSTFPNDRRVQCVVVPKPCVVHRLREFVRYFSTHQDRCFVRPTSTDIVYRVSAASKDEKRGAEFSDKVDALSMRCDGEIKGSKSVASKRVGSALKDNRRRTKCIDSVPDHGLEYCQVRFVIDAIQ